MKRLLLLFTALPILGISQQTYVPDDNFENFLETHDANHIIVSIGDPNSMGNGVANDDYVTTANISGVTYLDVSGEGVSDLTGIEDFTNLNYLDCYDNYLTSLDVSNCANLVLLDCESNYITNLDLSQNLQLQTLWCYENQLQSINVVGCINLEDFEFDNNFLTSIDLSTNVNLSHIDAWTNNLTSINLSNHPNIESIEVFDNQLECLNIENGNNTNIFEFECWGNPNLSCVEVDDPVWSTANWSNIDPQTSFSTNCNYPANCFSAPTSLQENTNNINVYPNPTNDQITIDIKGYNGPVNVELYDLQGRLLHTTRTTTVSLRKYERGIYIFKVSYGEITEEVRVVRN
jgi:hypothetical protein